LALDRTLTDKGRSAFHGEHLSDTGALGSFLDLIKSGAVPKGAYLIIENLDRLSRDEVVPATNLLTGILMAGVKVVQLEPVEQVLTAKSEGMAVMFAVMELSRAHSESKVKSVRSADNWARALKAARDAGRPMTGRLPAWVELAESGAMRLVPEKAKVVRRIFQLARDGYGAGLIVRRLTAEKVPAFGDREADPDDDEGATRAVAGGRYGSGEWRTSYVRNILSDRRAMGEFQPRDSKERKKGDAIPNYYPPAVSPEEWQQTRDAVTARKGKAGRVGENVANVFGGLLRNARDGSTYYARTRSEKGVVSRELLNQSAVEKKSPAYTFPYATFEDAVLGKLAELKVRDITGGAEGDDVETLERQRAWVRERRAEMKKALLTAGGAVGDVVEALATLAGEEAALDARIDGAASRAALPAGESIKVLKALASPQSEDDRLKVRAALRRLVKEIWVLVVPHGQDRLCVVQVMFVEGGVRQYFIRRRQPYRNQSGRTAGFWCSRTFAGSAHPLGQGSVALGSEDGLILADLTDRAAASRSAERLAGLTDTGLGVVFGNDRHTL
jgi:DNA invertase Pin-like site-specific DNA recombinase